MTHVVVIGAGLSGCVTAYELACRGVEVTLVEKTPVIGGKVRTYGCKATDKCQNCGVCLTGGLWDKVSRHPNIRIIARATAGDIAGVPGDFTVSVEDAEGMRYLSGVHAVVVGTGFESRTTGVSAHMQIEGSRGLMTGAALEEVMLGRTATGVFASPPGSVAFIQCLGSRDKKEGGLYCSRVCCAYSTRAAKVLRSYYPDCEIVFFYMELQNVEAGDYFAGLRELDMEFIKCRPLKISGGQPVVIEYDDPQNGITTRKFDLVVLSEGIHTGADNDHLAEVCGLNQDEDGFLRTVGEGSGVYVAGCVRTPMTIAQSYADAQAVAGAILLDVGDSPAAAVAARESGGGRP